MQINESDKYLITLKKEYGSRKKYMVWGKDLEISDGLVIMNRFLERENFRISYYSWKSLGKILEAHIKKEEQLAISISSVYNIKRLSKTPVWTTRTSKKARLVKRRYNRIVKRHEALPTILRMLGLKK